MKTRDVLNALLHKLTRLALRLRLPIQRRWGFDQSYQPNPFVNEGDNASKRLCIDRFNAFSEVFEPGVALSCMDIGCNQGYFVIRMAERGGFCLGIDYGRNEIMVAQATAKLAEVNNVAFAQLDVDEAMAKALPKVDVVICMSVFHHWVRRFGEDGARKIMDAVASRAGRYLVFETGQPEETGVAWADSLSFMGEDSQQWVEQYLLSNGFSRVEQVGEFIAEVSGMPRKLYVAVR
jgi:SAM-dependent methyltransferase